MPDGKRGFYKFFLQKLIPQFCKNIFSTLAVFKFLQVIFRDLLEQTLIQNFMNSIICDFKLSFLISYVNILSFLLLALQMGQQEHEG